MRQFIMIVLITTALIIVGCSNNEDPQPIDLQFNKFTGKILGYYIEGQEDTWGRQEISLLNVYADAIIFNNNDSVDVAYIGFGYGYDDLSQFGIITPNAASWKIDNDKIVLEFQQQTSKTWSILEIKNEHVTFQQESNNQIFSLKIMN